MTLAHVSTSRSLRGLVAALCLSVLGACGSPSAPPDSSGELQLNLRAAPNSHLPDDTRLRVFAVIDGGARTPLDTSDDAITGTIRGVSTGMHTLEIIVEYVHPTLGVIEIARTVMTLDVSGGTNLVSFEQSDYTFADDDGDDYANIDEIIAGTDPTNQVSLPPTGSVPASGRWNTMRWNQSNWR